MNFLLSKFEGDHSRSLEEVVSGSGLGTFPASQTVLRVWLGLPLGVKGSEELVHLQRLLLISEGLRGRDGLTTEVHEDGAGGENDVAVAFSVHGTAVTLAKDTRVAVAQTFRLLRRLRLLPRSHQRSPPGHPLSLLGLQRTLRRLAGAFQQTFLAQVALSAPPQHSFLLVDLVQPGEQLVRLALWHLRVGEPLQRRLGGPAGRIRGDLGLEDGHPGGGGGRKGNKGEGERQRDRKEPKFFCATQLRSTVCAVGYGVLHTCVRAYCSPQRVLTVTNTRSQRRF